MPFGPAGTPCGDVASVQGVSGGTPVPVSVSTLGQQTKAASVPVTVASDQGPLQITGSVYAIPTSSTDVGATPYRLIADGSTNATGVKASAGTVTGGLLVNRSAGWKYVKAYNKASAPTVGSDTPVQVWGVPAGASVPLHFPTGLQFSAGIALAITGDYPDADTTAVTAGDVIVNLAYK